MSRNQKNLMKFVLYALATLSLLLVVSVPDWQVYRFITLLVCVGVWLWCVWHVFNDK